MFAGLGGATSSTGALAAEPSPAEDGTKLINLSEKLDKPLCYARNENAAYPWGNLFIGDSRLGMQSDADEQLIIHLSFQEFVKVCSRIIFVCRACLLNHYALASPLRPQQVKSIKFTEWNRGTRPEMNPVTVHILVNRVNLGFEVRFILICFMQPAP